MRAHVNILFMVRKNPVLKHFTVLGRDSHMQSKISAEWDSQLNTVALVFLGLLKHHSGASEQYSSVGKGSLMIC